MNDSIFKPHFTETGLITVFIENIYRDRWLVDNVLLPPKHEVWMRREVAVQRAAGTTRIEGIELTEVEVSELQKRGSPGKPDDAERANINALQAYEFIDYLSDQLDIPVDELVMRELNRQFLRGESETLTPGVYRKGQNRIGNYTPPNQGDVPGLMRELALWCRSDEGLHPILKSGLAHIQLVAIHPFWDGNGRTARGLATLMLQRSTFSFKKLLSMEKNMAANRSEYVTSIERTLGPSYSSEYDATPWLEFYCSALSANSSILTKQMTDWRRMMTGMYDKFQEFDLNYRQTDGLAFASRTGKITRGDYIDITNASPVTASRDLAKLVELGLLEPQGNTRNRIYFLSLTHQEGQEEDAQLPLPSTE